MSCQSQTQQLYRYLNALVCSLVSKAPMRQFLIKKMTTVSPTSLHLRPHEPQTTPHRGEQQVCMFGFVKCWIKASTAAARNHPSGPLLSQSPMALYFVFKRRVSWCIRRQSRDEKRTFNSWLSRQRQKRDFRSRRNLPQFRPRTLNLETCLFNEDAWSEEQVSSQQLSLHYSRIYHFYIYYWLLVGNSICFFLIMVF